MFLHAQSTVQKSSVSGWMKTNDVATAYIAYHNSKEGKRRPVLIAKFSGGTYALVYKITTKYANKSVEIRKRYYHVSDVKIAGLKEESWIDTNSAVNINVKHQHLKVIGTLSIADVYGLATFIRKNKKG